jgi:subtilase family serine protease
MSHAQFVAVSPSYVLLNGGQRSSGLAGEHRAGPVSGATPAGYSSPVGYTPAQLRHAYGFDQISFNYGAVAADGSDQTIAIVDAYDDPNIASDLKAFDTQFGLSDPTFTKVAQDGSTKYPAGNAKWATEIALDVEWAHAIAPKANILLVEANSAGKGDLFTAVNYARNQPGVVAVSMSWGAGEWSSETSYDSYFTTPAGHVGVTFLAATLDAGAYIHYHDIVEYFAAYPAMSPNVVAVGGTNLALDSSDNILSEDGSSGSGGGISLYESQPGFQRWIGTSPAHRTTPDVSYNMDAGVPVYDSYNDPLNPWFGVGGTSAGTPQWAALVAIADQGRALKGLAALDGPNQTLPLLYSLQGLDYHDITTGNNGYAAGPGYDLVTGIGTPIANQLVADLTSNVGNTSAISWNLNDFGTVRTFYAIDATTYQTVEYYLGTYRIPLGGPTVTAVSASLYNPSDFYGSQVFALGTDHATYVFNSTGWHNLGGWARALSAARDDRVFVIGGDNAVYVNYSSGDGGTWWYLGGYVKAINAGLDDFYNDQVLGIGGDNHIYVHDAGSDPYWHVVDSTAKNKSPRVPNHREPPLGVPTISGFAGARLRHLGVGSGRARMQIPWPCL